MTVVSILLALSLSAGSTEVVAKVDRVEITADALARRVQQVRVEGKRATTEEVLQSLVDEAVLADEARRLGLAGSREAQARVEAEKRRQAAELFVERQVEAQFKPDDAQLHDLFHSVADFAQLESATFETPRDADAARARLRGGATFAEIAKSAVAASVYPNASAVPQTIRAEINPALATALFAAAPGAVVGPVETPVGVVIARLVGKSVGTEEQFRARRDSLVAYAKKQFEAGMRSSYAKHLRDTAHVELDRKFLESLGPAAPSRAELEHVIANVHGRPVRYGEIHATLRSIGATSGHLASPAIRVGIAWKEIDKRLLEDVAVERGLDRAPEIGARVPEIERAALAQAAIDHFRQGAPRPTQAEVEAYYRRNRVAYRGAPLDQVRADAGDRAADEKQVNAITARLDALRRSASISVDRAALARVAI